MSKGGKELRLSYKESINGPKKYVKVNDSSGTRDSKDMYKEAVQKVKKKGGNVGFSGIKRY